MTQDEINTVYSITIKIHTDPWFKDKTRDEVQEWVRKALGSMEIYTVPCGMSWGALADKEWYDEYNSRKK